LSIAARHGTRSQTIFRNIPKGELKPHLQLSRF
jgi:hypothetical protein